MATTEALADFGPLQRASVAADNSCLFTTFAKLCAEPAPASEHRRMSIDHADGLQKPRRIGRSRMVLPTVSRQSVPTGHERHSTCEPFAIEW